MSALIGMFWPYLAGALVGLLSFVAILVNKKTADAKVAKAQAQVAQAQTLAAQAQTQVAQTNDATAQANATAALAGGENSKVRTDAEKDIAPGSAASQLRDGWSRD